VVHDPVAQADTPRTKPWVADTKVTEAGLKPASETAGDDGATGDDVAVLGGGVDAGGAAADPPADAAADVAGAAGDETAGDVDAAAVLAGALPAADEWALLEQPAAASSATSMTPPTHVVHEGVM
jgi:hypothetical protein